MGQLYVDVHGDMILTSQKSGLVLAKVHFSKQGWTKKKKCKIDGHVFDNKGKEKVHITGNWHEKIYFKNITTGIEELVWQATPRNPDCEKQYNFNKFICNLNYIDEDMKNVIAITDTRLRPDQRYFE